MTTSPASICVVSVASLDRNLAFYRDVLGLDASPVEQLAGDAFTRHWHLPPGSTARSALLAHPASDVGRILLVEFDHPGANVRGPELTRQFMGLWNLNFYTTDIEKASRELAEHGCPSWTEPTKYAISGETGAPTEVIVDGPEGIIFNLVQPQGPPDTLVGQIRSFLDERGTTRTGYSEVVTTAHVVDSMEAALAFYRDGLGLEVWFDELFGQEASNRFLALPLDAISRIVFMKGDHLFGKVALSQPVNYTLPNFAPRMEAPAIGFLAMGFEVDDVDGTVGRVCDVGATVYSPPDELALPGLGLRRAALVRTPGSGALSWLVARG